MDMFDFDGSRVSIYMIFIIVWIVLVRKSWWTKRIKRKKLPGPRALPIIGSVLEIALVGRNCRNDQFCRKLCKKYGPVMEFKVGVQNFVVVEDYDVAKQIFNSDDWCGRIPTSPLFLEIFTDHQKTGILFNDGDSYRETRRFTIRCLKEFGFGQLQNMGIVIQQEVDHFITDLEIEHSFFDNNNNKVLADISLHTKFNLPALNVLWKYLCGTRFKCDDPFMIHVVSVIQRSCEAAAFGTKPLYAFPFLRFIPGLTDQQLLIGCFKDLRTVFEGIVADKRKAQAYKAHQNDFIDMFLKVIDDSDGHDSQVYSDEQLVQSCVDMALAGSDTTGNTIEYSILYMLEFPEIQRKVQQEIDRVIGGNQKPTISDRGKMPYTEATILEILRCSNVAAVDHRSTLRDTEICDSFIPKNTMVLLNLSQIHNDKSIWTDPEVFSPERFLNKDMEIINANKLCAFGGGKRLCIGKSMAKATFFIFFATLLQRYSFEPSIKYPEFSIRSFVGGFTSRPKIFYCTIKHRDTSYY